MSLEYRQNAKFESILTPSCKVSEYDMMTGNQTHLLTYIDFFSMKFTQHRHKLVDPTIGPGTEIVTERQKGQHYYQ